MSRAGQKYELAASVSRNLAGFLTEWQVIVALPSDATHQANDRIGRRGDGLPGGSSWAEAACGRISEHRTKPIFPTRAALREQGAADANVEPAFSAQPWCFSPERKA